MSKRSGLNLLVLSLSLNLLMSKSVLADNESTGSQNWDCSHIFASDLEQVQKDVNETNKNIGYLSRCVGAEENVDRATAKGLPDKVYISGSKLYVCKGYVKSRLFVRLCGFSGVNTTCFYNTPDPRYPNTYLLQPPMSEPTRHDYGKTYDSFSCEEVKTYDITTKEESTKNLEELKQAMQSYNAKLISGLKDQISAELKSDTFKSRVVEVLNKRNEKRN
jgi:hypothetical protein